MRQVVPSDDDVSNCNTLTKEAGNDKTSTMRPRGERPVSDNESAGSSEASGTVLDRVKDQFGVRGMIKEYMIPVETNIVSYILGGVLAISLVLEIATGMLLAMRYVPDAGRAYGITNTLLHEGGWSVVLNFHYWNAYLIFALIMCCRSRLLMMAASPCVRTC